MKTTKLIALVVISIMVIGLLLSGKALAMSNNEFYRWLEDSGIPDISAPLSLVGCWVAHQSFASDSVHASIDTWFNAFSRSSAEVGRSSGFLESSRNINRSSSSGISNGLFSDGGPGASLTCLIIIAIGVSPSNSSSPVSNQ